MIARTLLAAAFLAAPMAAPAQAQDLPNTDLAGSYYHFALAKMADFEMRYADSISEFERAIELDPSSDKIRVEFASTLIKARQVERAIEQCKKAIELNPQSSTPHFLLGQIHKASLETGDEDKIGLAIQEFRRAVELDEENFEALFYLGQLLFYSGQHEESAATFGRFIRLRPNVPKAYNYRAGSLIKLGEVHGAIEVLEESLKRGGESIENLELLGRLYEETDQPAKASEVYLQALALAPTTELKFRAGVALARQERYGEAVELFRDVVREVPAETAFQVELGKALDGSGNFAEAAETFRGVLRTEPDNVEATYYLASSQRALGNRAEAIEGMRRLLKITDDLASRNPQQAAQLRLRFKSFLAVLYQESRQFDEAVALFREVAEANPEDVRPKLGLVYALKDARRIQEALRLTEELLKSRPEDLDVLFARARMLSASGRLEDAVGLLQSAREGGKFADQAEDLQLATSQLYAEHKMYSRAEQTLRQAQEEFPASERLQFQLGAMLERQGKHDEAEGAFQSILKENDKHAPVLNYLGYMLAERGVRLQEALGYVQRALAIEPYNGAYLDSLGWVHFKLNQLEQAEDQLVRAARINDSDPTIYEHLGDLYYKLGDYAKARDYYQRSVQFADDPAEREKVEVKLASLIRLLRPEQK